MNHDEAKFLLRARRPGARDAGDQRFAEALAEVARDPKLQAWHEAEERFDAALAAKFAEVAAPAGLRDAILAGARASAVPGPRVLGRGIAWLAAAAALTIGSVVIWQAVVGRAPAGDDLPQVAMRDLADAHDAHDGQPAGLGIVQARLASAEARLAAAMPLQLDELERARCRAVTIAGREVFEICFQREGAWYHLYAVRGQWGNGMLREAARGRLVAAAWSDAQNSYALVTDAGRDALRRVL